MRRSVAGSLFHTALIGLAALGTAGCALFDEDPAILLTVTVGGGPNPTAPEPTLTVTALNRSDARVVWGQGSSSCQLDAVVALSRTVWKRAVISRGCTDDLVEQGLDPGASRTEQLVWLGEVLGDGVPEYVPRGHYDVRATAGTVALSKAVSVEVTTEPLYTP